MPDDPNLHDDDGLDLDINDDLDDDTSDDDLETPADTDDNLDDDDSSDEPKKGNADAEQVKQNQKKAWLKAIKSGKKTLDDMPKNLGWLRDDIKKDLKVEKKPKKVDNADIDSRIDRALTERSASATLDALIEGLEDSKDITAEQSAQLYDEYKELVSDFDNPTPSQQLKALTTAARLVGLKDVSSYAKERRSKGMILPPFGGKRRKPSNPKPKEDDIDEEMAEDLPRGYSAKRPKKS